MADDVHDRHSNNDTNAPASNSKPAVKGDAKSKHTQKVRDAHFRENGVDDSNVAPRNKIFDEKGRSSKRPAQEDEK